MGRERAPSERNCSHQLPHGCVNASKKKRIQIEFVAELDVGGKSLSGKGYAVFQEQNKHQWQRSCGT